MAFQTFLIDTACMLTTIGKAHGKIPQEALYGDCIAQNMARKDVLPNGPMLRLNDHGRLQDFDHCLRLLQAQILLIGPAGSSQGSHREGLFRLVLLQ